MECNYRSTKAIVEKAQKLIENNNRLFDKNMTSACERGKNVCLDSVDSREEQYKKIVEVAKKSLNEEIAILYRDNDSALGLIDQLDRNGVSFKINKPLLNLFDDHVIRDVINYFSFAIDNNSESFFRICNKGILFLTKKQKYYLKKRIDNRKVSLVDAIEEQINYSKNEYINKNKEFINLMKTIAVMKPYDAIELLLENGYNDYIKNKQYDFGKIEILEMLAKEEQTIGSFILRLEYLKDITKSSLETANIILSTIHSSKGMEFDNVYMLDIYDGKFPSEINIDKIQEERRLMYVGITRAKKYLHLFKIHQRNSIFINELFSIKQNNSISLNEKKKVKRINYKKQTVDEKSRQKRYEEVINDDFNGEKPILDSINKRWYKCEVCGIVKEEKEFGSFGGLKENYGTCNECYK